MADVATAVMNGLFLVFSAVSESSFFVGKLQKHLRNHSESLCHGDVDIEQYSNA